MISEKKKALKNRREPSTQPKEIPTFHGRSAENKPAKETEKKHPISKRKAMRILDPTSQSKKMYKGACCQKFRSC